MVGAQKRLKATRGKLGLPSMDLKKREEKKKKPAGSSCNHSADLRDVSFLDFKSSDHTPLLHFSFTPVSNCSLDSLLISDRDSISNYGSV